ncbi:MAG: LLM class flavin-dependent oxidoreductase [Chloroflexales bacterium]|nr:LLM class flavin-dependent oxidoreductase [Chloroflexales bacterium]
MRFSVRFNNDLPVRRYPVLAQAAEAAGFDQFWVSNDLFLRGVWPILSACALATSRLELGVCIVNPYTMHPAEIAMQAAALDELSGGRFNLGVAAGAAEFLGWVGLAQERPLSMTAETLRVLRALFAGERGPFGGQALPTWTEEAYLRFPARAVPLYLGAMSPQMQRLIGSAADGGLPLLFPPENYAEVRAHVQTGATVAGRDIGAIDLAACLWISIAADRNAAADALREKIAYYGNAMSDSVLQRLGVEREAMAALAYVVQTERDMPRAKAIVSEAMLRIGVVGDSRDVIARLETLVAMGATHLSFGPPLGPDPLVALEMLGRDVIPHFNT